MVIHNSNFYCRSFRWLVCTMAIAVFAISTAYAEPELTLRADTVYFNSADSTGMLTIYLQSRVDSVAAYQFWIQLDRPDIAEFTGVLDTTGTLSSGWELMNAHSLGGPADITVIGMADYIFVPGSVGPIVPQTTERPLIRLQFRILPIPDTMTDRVATVNFSRIPNLLSFARPNGTTIGLGYSTLADTACWKCYSWSGTDCLVWGQIPGSVCDSISVTVDTMPIIDSLKLATVAGALINEQCPRTLYDIDINADGMPMAVSDLVALLRLIVGDTTAVGDPRSADVNGDCRIDWADAILLDSLFRHATNPPPEFGPYLPCTCDNPIYYCCWQLRGDLNSDLQHIIDLSDLSLLTAYIGGQPVEFKCFDEANVNGVGIVDLTDLSVLVSFLTSGGGMPAACP